jgi:CRP-like cAMP-binding protein
MKINLFNKDTEFLSFAAGQTVFKEGDEGDRMYAVVEGVVDIIIKGNTVEKVSEGGVFGEMALIEARPRVASAVVSADAKLVPVDRRRFEFLVQQNPFFALQLMTIMAERLRKMDATISPF